MLRRVRLWCLRGKREDHSFQNHIELEQRAQQCKIWLEEEMEKVIEFKGWFNESMEGESSEWQAGALERVMKERSVNMGVKNGISSIILPTQSYASETWS